MTASETLRGSDRILVVDDEPDIRQVLEKTLRRLGYEVSVAEQGEEALKLAVELRPQVLLADIRMPQMDGHTLLRRIAAQHLDTAVIVMSGHGDMDDVIDALRNGAVDYIRKPWGPSELISAVGRAVDIHDHRQSARRASGTAEPPPAASHPPSFSASAPSAPARPETAVLAGSPTAPLWPSAAVLGPATTAPTELASQKPPETPQTDSVFGAILEQVRRGEIVLPPFPAVLAELRSLLSRPEPPMNEIVVLVERDPRLAVQVLRIAKTAHYSRGAHVNDIHSAVGRIGLRQVQSLVQTVFARYSHQARDPVLRQLQTRIWRYSIARAVSMRGLAELAGAGAHLEPETAYIAGLLADSGASFLLWVIGERIASGSRPPADPKSYVLGLRDQHQEVGAGLLARWELGPVVTLIGRTHHLGAPPAPPNSYWSLVILGTAMADGLSAGDDPTATASPSPALVDRCGAELRIGTTAATKIAASVRREFEGIMEALA